MQMYCAEVTVSNDATLTIKGVPFQVSDEFEVIVRSRGHEKEIGGRYPLRDKSIRYVDQFESVAEDNWGVLR